MPPDSFIILEKFPICARIPVKVAISSATSPSACPEPRAILRRRLLLTASRLGFSRSSLVMLLIIASYLRNFFSASPSCFSDIDAMPVAQQAWENAGTVSPRRIAASLRFCWLMPRRDPGRGTWQHLHD